MKKLIGLIVLAPVFMFASTANADETFCGLPGGETLATGPHDNVTVFGGICNVDSSGTTKINGNVKVEPGGTFNAGILAGGKLIVKGSVQCDFCRRVALVDRGGVVKVKGDFQIKGATVVSGCAGPVSIGGNLQMEEMTGNPVATGCSITGDLQVFKNVSTFAAFISGNTVGGNLQCKENFPAPGPFIVNTVSGNKEDQCAAGLGF